MKYFKLLSLLFITLSVSIFTSHVKAESVNTYTPDIIVMIGISSGNGAILTSLHVNSLSECKTAIANLHGIWKTNSIMNDSFCYYQNKPTEIYQYRCTNRNSWTNLCNGVYIFEMTKLLPSATDTLELQ